MNGLAAPHRRWTRAAGGAAGALGLAAAGAAVSVAWHHPATHALAQLCCHYSPARLAGGAVWTVIGSALLLPRVQMIGPTTLMTSALFLPYALAAGARSALRVFFTGHVAATLAVAGVVIPAAALGWGPAVVLLARTDVGASAGLAAAGGACCLLLGGRRAGPILFAILAGWFSVALLRTHRLVEVEHLIALGAGGALQWTRGPLSIIGSPLSNPEDGPS